MTESSSKLFTRIFLEDMQLLCFCTVSQSGLAHEDVFSERIWPLKLQGRFPSFSFQFQIKAGNRKWMFCSIPPHIIFPRGYLRAYTAYDFSTRTCFGNNTDSTPDWLAHHERLIYYPLPYLGVWKSAHFPLVHSIFISGKLRWFTMLSLSGSLCIFQN